MQNDVLSQIRRMRDVEEVVVLTHNIDFIFLQTVFISALKKCGHPNLTIFADSQCAFESYKSQYSLLSGLGARYRVIPVQMSKGFRFHPKAVFLGGKKSATLFVGSGNLTFGGMRENAEVWSRFSVEEDGSKISGFRDYLQAILPLVGFPKEAERDLADAFSPDNYEWVPTLPVLENIWFAPGSGQSLIDYIARTVTEKQPKKLIVCTPYFDSEAQALQDLSAKLGNIPTDVYIQSGKSTLLQAAANKLTSNITIKSIRAMKSGSLSNRFIHAKWFAVECAGGIEFFHGSANCSRAALTKEEPFSNAELMVSTTVLHEEFDELIMSELQVNDTLPVLPHELPDEDDHLSMPIILASARFEYGRIRLAYKITGDVVISELLVDSHSVVFEASEDGEISAQLLNQPRDVVLTGTLAGLPVESNHLWVDDDSRLRSNAASRNIIAVIKGAQDDDGHDPRKWVLVFNLVGKNLSELGSQEIERTKKTAENEVIRVSTGFLTSNDYSSFRALPTHHIGLPSNASIYSLLLNVFGIHGRIVNETEAESAPETASSAEEEVDLPEQMPSRLKVKTRKASGREVEKLTSSAVKIVDRLCEAEYLSGRDPSRLGLDLQVIGLLLRKAYSMGWLDKRLYHTLSHQVWSNLFFHTTDHKGKGWLEVRVANESDDERFLVQFVTPMLTASLYAWFSAVSYDPDDVYSRRFRLTQILAMGRCAWLWKFDDATANQIAVHLKQIWADSPCGETTHAPEELFVRFAEEVNDYAILGVALTKMETELNSLPIEDVRAIASVAEVQRGDLLWQGSKGFCLAMSDAKERDRIEVLSLQDPENSSQFLVGYLIPMKGLLNNIDSLCRSLSVEEIEKIDCFVSDFNTLSRQKVQLP